VPPGARIRSRLGILIPVATLITQSASARFREAADPIWEAQHAHPFVRGIGDGTLDAARFGFWLRQDWLYLIDYSRLFAEACCARPTSSR
jgi:thiaminase